MTSQVLKKTDIDQGGAWVRPVQLASDSARDFSLNADSPESTPPMAQSGESGAEQQLARIRSVLHDLTTQLAHDKERLLDELRPHLVRLAISIAQRIVAAEIHQDWQMVERTVRAALKELSCEGELQVRVHPDDKATIEQALGADETILSGISELRVIADPSVERGGCIVESDYGTIDANIPTQFAQLQRTLLAYLED